MSDITLLIFQLLVLIFSVVIHELSHGYVAEQLGDPTARLAGRLTFNPISHFSFFGMIVLPILSSLAWGIPIGSAKPVPYNPSNLRNPQKGEAIIAVAGPLSNLLIATIFGVILRGVFWFGYTASIFAVFLGLIVYINILLAVFNLVPIPPIDGSKAINLLLPSTPRFYWNNFWNRVSVLIREHQLLFLLILFLSFKYVLIGVFSIIDPVIRFLYLLITGSPFAL